MQRDKTRPADFEYVYNKHLVQIYSNPYQVRVDRGEWHDTDEQQYKAHYLTYTSLSSDDRDVYRLMAQECREKAGKYKGLEKFYLNAAHTYESRYNNRYST